MDAEKHTFVVMLDTEAFIIAVTYQEIGHVKTSKNIQFLLYYNSILPAKLMALIAWPVNRQLSTDNKNP